MAIKKFLTLEGQVEKLRNKNVVIDDTDIEKILCDNNYYNLVSCSKIKFATERNPDGSYIYPPSNFTDWLLYFDIDCTLVGDIMKNILHFERVVNSRTAYYVSELLHSGTLCNKSIDTLNDAIAGRLNSTHYQGNEPWKHIAHKTFGELRQIIKWLWRNNKRDIVRKIFANYPFLKNNTLNILDEIVNLRNSVFHFVPISIYLTYDKSQYNIRKKVIEYMYFENPAHISKNDMVEIFRETKKFVTIKKQPISIG